MNVSRCRLMCATQNLFSTIFEFECAMLLSISGGNADENCHTTVLCQCVRALFSVNLSIAMRSNKSFSACGCVDENDEEERSCERKAHTKKSCVLLFRVVRCRLAGLDRE